MQSYIFDFEKSPSFMRKWNKEFDVEDIGTNCFNIVLVDDICDDNISDCLNQDGQLKYDESHLKSVECSLVYNEDSDYDTSNIALANSVTVPFTTDEVFSMKGVFITNDAGYVMGYSIYTTSINISNLSFEKDLILWDIVEGSVHV